MKIDFKETPTTFLSGDAGHCWHHNAAARTGKDAQEQDCWSDEHDAEQKISPRPRGVLRNPKTVGSLLKA
jgi:hypothetical protein